MTELLKSNEWLISMIVTLIVAPVTILVVKSMLKQMEARSVADRAEKAKQHSNELQNFKEEYRKFVAKNNENAIKVVVENGKLRELLDADTVFVVQPHPKGNHSMLTAHLEDVKGNLAFLTKDDRSRRVSINKVLTLVGSLSTEVFFIRQLCDATDKTAQSILAAYGVQKACCHMLRDADGTWVGTLVACNPSDKLTDCHIRMAMAGAAIIISPILPTIEE